ncbi:S8 family serine peptidase [Flavilitoribacter nigricans]|uniref:Peptidase S8/S53 domain-containing protein n=1 Tax=Flavilitoribacter nigricans (strain ATCC 23147 / DSM 23189 / NBRC 102662 / NCIMB 1420 / SS-2) TaxID=1122177 RepID=A0A2D0ND70_FLAN2|nr:S8 family serine peptidase [Flavilitoribacter nigricans]PHN06320.1 hypothetical protein CRP01_12160 [Flavilitoribacter nigricans DSM 23189 = NBRC 102662]
MSRRKYILLGMAIIYSAVLFGQDMDIDVCYWVSFSDKAQSEYQVEAPNEFLSERALSRRARFGIPLTETDLPVNAAYLDSLKTAGTRIQYTSRWLNGAAMVATPAQAKALESLSFVDSIRYIGPYFGATSARNYKYVMDSTGMKMESNKYGRSGRNIQMLNGDSLHQMGFQGEGMYIAVLDGGFTNVDKIPFFDTLRHYQSLDHFYDFTNADRDVFESSTHGTSVLSAMAAYSPGVLVGTAPRARYVCLKTEEVRGEHRMEEYNWVAALEYADSLGVDVVNSSLGYYAFSDHNMDYHPRQLDGKTSPASRAAEMAFDRGMIIVVSAGNEGDSRWKYIDIPADSPKALAIAAVMNDGQKAGFSSYGYDSLEVIKPDLAAPGVNVPVPNAYRSRLSAASGTSLAAPIMTGLVTCLWQAFPELANSEIVAALKASGHQAEQPDLALGYGIPDFMKAYRILQARKTEMESKQSE